MVKGLGCGPATIDRITHSKERQPWETKEVKIRAIKNNGKKPNIR
jgi:hypothetical protein